MSDYQKRLQEARERIEKQRAERENNGGLWGALYAQAEAQEKAKAEGKAYRNRDKIPEPLLEYADTYHWLTGQTPSNRRLPDWIQELWYWQDEGLEKEAIARAYDKLRDSGITVVRPGSLTNTAVAIQAQSVQTPQQGPRML